MSTLTEVTTHVDFNKHLSSTPPAALVIISFHTPWAAPCAQMATVLKTLAASYPVTTPPTTVWLSLNAEDLPDISEQYDVTAVPFLALVRNKKVLETVSGSDAAKVRSAIEKHALNTNAERKGKVYDLPPLQEYTPRETDDTESEDLGINTSGKDDPSKVPQSSSQESETPKEDLHKRLSDLVKAAPVMLFMKGTPSSPQCGFSRQLVTLLRENSVKYGFFNILADDEVRQGLKVFADWPTFPQLWIEGDLVGGLDIVKEEVANDPTFFKDHSIKSVPTPVLSSETVSS